MKKKQTRFFLAGFLGITLAIGILLFLKKGKTFIEPNVNIPKGVIEKFTQLSQNKSRLGTSLYSCEKDNVITYTIVSNSFNENYSVSFDGTGKELETHLSGDIVDANHPPQPTTKLDFYQCADITNKLK